MSPRPSSRDWTPVEDLVIALPKTDGPQVLVEKADDGQTYFAIQDYPAAAQAADRDSTSAPPRRVVVFWDASGSRAGDHKREIAVLRGYLEYSSEASFRHDAGEPSRRSTSIWCCCAMRSASRAASGSPLAARWALTADWKTSNTTAARSFGAIGPLPGAEKPDFYMLFTDGISNFGREEPARLDAPLYIFSADAGANHAFLHSLAMANGGRYFNLANWKDADMLRHRPAGLVVPLGHRSRAGGSRTSIRNCRSRLPAGFTLAGRLTGETATVAADYGIAGGKPGQQTFKCRAPTRPAARSCSGFGPGRSWPS